MNILNPEHGYINKTTIQYAERRLVVRKLFNSKQRRRWGETPFVINRINIKISSQDWINKSKLPKRTLFSNSITFKPIEKQKTMG